MKGAALKPTWTTNDEIDYLNGLGSHSQLEPDRITMLHSYIAAAQRRSDWGDVDSASAIGYAKRLLMVEGD